MSDRSKIEWTDASWNPLRARRKGGAGMRVGWHCEHVTEACRNCYAEAINKRLGTGLDYKPGNKADIELFLDEKTLLQPLHWKKPRRIFPCSMTDLFGDWVADEQLDKIFAVMALTPQHTYQVLTKRPERMRKYVGDTKTCLPGLDVITRIALAAETLGHDIVPASLRACWPLPNLWLLISICDQKDADAFVPILLDTPAAVHGVSYEPALGPVEFHERLGDDWLASGLSGERKGLDWVICGGESGPHARPMHPDWARSLRDQCAAAGVAFFHKQNGEWIDADEWLDDIERGPGQIIVNGERWRPARPLNFADAKLLARICGDHVVEHQSDGTTLVRIGKKRAGRLLDGVEHNAFPTSRAQESDAA